MTIERMEALMIIAEQKHTRMRCDIRVLLSDAKDAIEVGYPDVALDRIKSVLRMTEDNR